MHNSEIQNDSPDNSPTFKRGLTSLGRTASTRESVITFNTTHTTSSQNSLLGISDDASSSADSALPRRLIKGLPDRRLIKFAEKVKKYRQLAVQQLEEEIEEDENRRRQAEIEEEAHKAKVEASAKEEAESQAMLEAEAQRLAQVSIEQSRVGKSPKKDRSGFFKEWRKTIPTTPSDDASQIKKPGSSKTVPVRTRRWSKEKGHEKAIRTPQSLKLDESHPFFHEFSWELQDAFWPSDQEQSVPHVVAEEPQYPEDRKRKNSTNSSRKSKSSAIIEKTPDTTGTISPFEVSKRPVFNRNPTFNSSQAQHLLDKKRACSVPTTLDSIDERESEQHSSKKHLTAHSEDMIHSGSQSTTSRVSSLVLSRLRYDHAKESISSSFNSLSRRHKFPKPITPVGMPVLYPFNVIGPPTRDPEEAKRDWSNLMAMNSRKKNTSLSSLDSDFSSNYCCTLQKHASQAETGDSRKSSICLSRRKLSLQSKASKVSREPSRSIVPDEMIRFRKTYRPASIVNPRLDNSIVEKEAGTFPDLHVVQTQAPGRRHTIASVLSTLPSTRASSISHADILKLRREEQEEDSDDHAPDSGSK